LQMCGIAATLTGVTVTGRVWLAAWSVAGCRCAAYLRRASCAGKVRVVACKTSAVQIEVPLNVSSMSSRCLLCDVHASMTVQTASGSCCCPYVCPFRHAHLAHNQSTNALVAHMHDGIEVVHIYSGDSASCVYGGGVHGVGDQGQNTMVAHMHTLGIWVVHIFTGDRALCVYGGGVHGWGLGDSSNRLMAHMRTLSIALVHIYSGDSASC
jgi:hypothetical protein